MVSAGEIAARGPRRLRAGGTGAALALAMACAATACAKENAGGGSGGASGTTGGASGTTGGRSGSSGGAGGGAPGSGGAGLTGSSGGAGPAGGAAGGSTATGGAVGSGGGGVAPFACPAGPFPAPALAGLVPARIAAVPPHDAFNNNGNNFSIIEGPVWIGDGLYISEIASPPNPPPSRILKVTPAGAVSVALDNAGTNGLALDRAGNLVGCSHKDGSVVRFGPPPISMATTATAILSGYMNARFDSPNDVTFGANGDMYFSDPEFQSPSPAPQMRQRLYRLAAGTTTPTVVDENRPGPNGVTLSPDGRTLYATGQDGLFRYPVATDGTVGTGTKIVQSIGSGDGMAIDCAGNIYVATNNTLVVVDPSGAVLGTITVPGVQGVTNAAFGGADHRTLYITALGSGTQSGLFSAALNVPGYPF